MVRGSLWYGAYEEGDSVVNYRNRVYCENVCSLMNGDRKCMNVLFVNPFSRRVLSD